MLNRLHSLPELLLFVHLVAQLLLQTEYEIVFVLYLQLQVDDRLLLGLENCLKERWILGYHHSYKTKPQPKIADPQSQ